MHLLMEIYERTLAPLVNWLFFHHLIYRTRNFSSTKWHDHRIRQNIFDLWTIQETIFEVQPELLIECGTNQGGSALYFANLFDLMGQGRVVTIDVERLHELSHERITFLLGNSVAPTIVNEVQRIVETVRGPIIVILDSCHTAEHVFEELKCYSRFVTPNSYCLVQDGVIDCLFAFRGDRPGPLRAVNRFMRTNEDFVVDRERCKRFLITHHPQGWLKRKPRSPSP